MYMLETNNNNYILYHTSHPTFISELINILTVTKFKRLNLYFILIITSISFIFTISESKWIWNYQSQSQFIYVSNKKALGLAILSCFIRHTKKWIKENDSSLWRTWSIIQDIGHIKKNNFFFNIYQISPIWVHGISYINIKTLWARNST